MPIGTIEHLMREAEEFEGPPSRLRREGSPTSGLRSSSRPSADVPSVHDPDDGPLEPTRVAEGPPPDSLAACVKDGSGEDVVAAIVEEMSRATAADDGELPQITVDEDEALHTENGTELMVVRAEPRISAAPPQPSAPPAARGPAFPEWVGVSMRFSLFEDHRRRDLVLRAVIALGAFAVTVVILLWIVLG